LPNPDHPDPDNLEKSKDIFMKQPHLNVPTPFDNLRLLRINEVVKITGISKSYIHALAASGRFPKSIPLVEGGSSRAWLDSEVQDYVKARIASRDLEVANG
jgi:prophage regulatory protein